MIMTYPTIAIGAVAICLAACRDAPPGPFDPAQMRVEVVKVPGGEFPGRRLYCASDWAKRDQVYLPDDIDQIQRVSTQQVEAYRIDRAVATCDQYRACVAARACPALGREYPTECAEGIAVMPVEAARRYCAWRGGRLPTYLEWQRANRDRGMRTPPNEPSCDHPTSNQEAFPRCLYTSELGVTYALRSANRNEWLSDVDCYVALLERWRRGPVAVEINGPELFFTRHPERGTAEWGGGGEFRCVNAIVEPR